MVVFGPQMKLDPKRANRRKKLIGQVKEILPSVLKRYPTISRVWLVGSIANPIFFDMRSDIDIVIDGLPKEQYFQLMNYLERSLGCELDLIMYGDIEEKNKKVLDKRIVIYEKTRPQGKTDIEK